MVARSPPRQQIIKKTMVAPLNPTKLRETLNKVDKCMARLQELQYTVTGGNKVISGVSLSPRSTRGYLRTSLRCKQESLSASSRCKHESLRIKNGNPRKSPGKFPINTEEWRRMSLPAMLLGETVGEIIKASQFTREIVSVVKPKIKKPNSSVTGDPKTPVTIRRTQRHTNPENSELRQRRNREKQIIVKPNRSDSKSPILHRARSRINFKISPPKDKENAKYIANRVSPRNKPWAKKAVLFPNPLFHSTPNSNQTKHKFLIKSPNTKSPGKFQVKIKSPPVVSISPTRQSRRKSICATAEKFRRSFSPSRLANRLVSPLKRKSVQNSSEGMKMMMSGLKQRPNSVQNAFFREVNSRN